MLIAGAKGLAKEILEILYQSQKTADLVFFDDVNDDVTGLLYNSFKVLKTADETAAYFKSVSNEFTVGIGNPFLRKKLYEKFTALGGQFTSTISPLATIGHFGNTIETGCNIMAGTVITNDVFIGKGTLINPNCTIAHDCVIAEFVEISPGVNIAGNCKIGAYTALGTNATVLPKITIGSNVIVAAGAVVTKDIPDNCMVAGVPAVIKKELPINF